MTRLFNLPPSYPILLQVGSNYFGSGFFLDVSNNVYLVTARHVLYNVESGQNPPPLRATNLVCTMWSEITNSGPNYMEINLAEAASSNEVRFSLSRDIAIVRICVNANIGGLSLGYSWVAYATNSYSHFSKTVLQGQTLKYDDVTIGRDVFLFGFPRSLVVPQLGQLDPVFPLIRKGTVAGKNLHNKTIILDCPVYEGNSGGPVLLKSVAIKGNAIVTSYSIIGIAIQFVPFVEIWKNEELNYYNSTVSNSGYSGGRANGQHL